MRRSKRRKPVKQRRDRKTELLLSHALRRILSKLEDVMAIGPDAILNSFKPLTPADTDQVDDLEKQLDQHLIDNYHEDAVVSWTVPVVITLDQTRELCRRYRKTGWRVVVGGEPENRFLILSKETYIQPQPESDLAS